MAQAAQYPSERHQHDAFEMVVIDGIRYRSDDPKLKQLRKEEIADKAVKSPSATKATAPGQTKRPRKRAADARVADEA